MDFALTYKNGSIARVVRAVDVSDAKAFAAANHPGLQVKPYAEAMAEVEQSEQDQAERVKRYIQLGLTEAAATTAASIASETAQPPIVETTKYGRARGVRETIDREAAVPSGMEAVTLELREARYQALGMSPAAAKVAAAGRVK